jgi:hypothetical protein
MEDHKIPIQPLESPLRIYIRRQSPTIWVAQSDYFFRMPIFGSEHGEVRLEPGTPVTLPTDISHVYVHNGYVFINWMFEGGYLDITELVHEENGTFRFRAARRL